MSGLARFKLLQLKVAGKFRVMDESHLVWDILYISLNTV